MNKIQTYKVLNNIIMGTALGTGGMLVLKSMADVLDLKRKAEAEEKLTELSNSTSVKVAKTEPAISDANLEALKYISFLLSVPTAMYGTSKLYDVLKHKNVKSDRDDAEQTYYKNLKLLADVNKNEKYANSVSKTYAATAAALLAVALSSAYLTRTYLKSQYPLLDEDTKYDTAKDLFNIKRVKFVKKDNDTPETSQQNTSTPDLNLVGSTPQVDFNTSFKIASKVVDCLTPNVNEYLIKLASTMEQGDLSHDIGLSDIINSVALGEIDNLTTGITDTDTIFKIAEANVKKHASKVINSIDTQLATTYIANDDTLSQCVMPYVVSVINDKYKDSFIKQASALPLDNDTYMEHTIKIAMANMADKIVLKQAFESSVPPVGAILNNKVDTNVDYNSMIYKYLTSK